MQSNKSSLIDWFRFGINAFLALILSVSSITAMAHHSRANFLLDEKDSVSIEGRIVEYTWRSPHVWAALEEETPSGKVKWVLEGNAIPALRKLGWNKDSLKLGDLVRATGSPDRDPNKKLIFLADIRKSDGTLLPNMPPKGAASALAIGNEKVTPSTDFTGTWSVIRDKESFLVGVFDPPTHWPLSEKGKAQVAAFNLDNDPFYRCIPNAIPRNTVASWGQQWKRNGDKIFIYKELSPFVRTVHMDMDSHPENIEPSRIGHSIGRKEGDSIVIDTIGFVPDTWGLFRGLDSSEHKHLIEKYTLVDGGMTLQLDLTIEDSEYLAEPVTETYRYMKVKDYELEPWSCDEESASKHLKLK